MSTTDRTATRRLRAILVRSLTCVLLVGITYASTVGSVHSHEDNEPGHHAGASGATGQASFSDEAPRHLHTHSHECLICLLQQNLFNGALYKVPSAPAPPTAAPALAPSAAAIYSSAADTPRRGRAPPAASLL